MPPALLYYAIPGFLILLSLEAWFSYKEQKHLYEKKRYLEESRVRNW